MSSPPGLPLSTGSHGAPVGDLQARLARIDLPVHPDPRGVFGAPTRAAVEAFQHRRGLRVDGIVGVQTWAALVEAGFRIGDRFLYLRRPMLRGDDIAELQRRLCALGFDTGRVDGIFGPLTADGLAEFQRNVGIPVDGILGAATMRELRRVEPRRSDGRLVSAVRESERLRQTPATLLDRRIAVGEEGGLDPLISALRRSLGVRGAHVVPLLHPSGSVQAAAANAAEVELYVGLRLDPFRSRCEVAYYRGFDYESPGGHRLAELVGSKAAASLGVTAAEAIGMSLPVLRETRMPAVLCEVGPAALVVQRTAELADALAQAIAAWIATPVTD